MDSQVTAMKSAIASVLLIATLAAVGTPPAAAQALQGRAVPLLPLGPVFGTITEAQGPAAGAPVPDARVTLFTPDLSFFRETRSDWLGRYAITNVPKGVPLRLGAAARDHEYEERSLILVATIARQDFALLPETHAGAWSVIGSTLPEFFDATDIAMLSAQGKVFFCHDTLDPVLFDPLTGTKTFPAGSYSPQGCTSATQFLDGRLVFVGGQSPTDPGSFGSAVNWVKSRLVNGTWQPLANLLLAAGRWYPGLARLPDGSLLVMGGGMKPDAKRTDTCEVFAAATGSWNWTGSMLNPVEYPPSALLFDGRVLATWSPPQTWSPLTGAWVPTGSFVQPDRGWPDHSDHSIVVLSDGRVLALGIRRGVLPDPVMGEIWDPASGKWSLTANAGLVRKRAEVVQLPDGRVFVGAGEAEAPPPVPDVLGMVKWCDLYDPALDAWRRVADMQWFREYHAVTLLVPDGRVITTGGTKIKFQYGPTSADIEAFEPPYLFRGVRPQIASISSTALVRGATITLDIFPATQLTRVVLMGFGAPTHWVDGGIPRRLELAVSQTGTTTTVTLPTDPSVLPLGWYMLFAMVDDIPSAARIVSISG